MQEKERIAHIISELEKLSPQDLCSLQYRIPHELLIAVRLSAQCTDARVNQVVPALFAKYPSIEAFAEADVAVEGDHVRHTILDETGPQIGLGVGGVVDVDLDGRVLLLKVGDHGLELVGGLGLELEEIQRDGACGAGAAACQQTGGHCSCYGKCQNSITLFHCVTPLSDIHPKQKAHSTVMCCTPLCVTERGRCTFASTRPLCPVRVL